MNASCTNFAVTLLNPTPRPLKRFTSQLHPMRKIVAGFAASLDGLIEGPKGEYDWILIDPAIDFAAQQQRFDTYFYGRKTYEMVKGSGNAAGRGLAHYVFSNTLAQTAGSFQLVKGDLKSAVDRIREQPGKDIAVFGGASLLASLLDLQLVDEVSVAVIPVLLGAGKPMVAALKEKVWLTLLDTKSYGNGTVQVTYAVHYNRRNNRGQKEKRGQG